MSDIIKKLNIQTSDEEAVDKRLGADGQDISLYKDSNNKYITTGGESSETTESVAVALNSLNAKIDEGANIEVATTTQDGLMSKDDKYKLDNFDIYTDENLASNIVFNSDGSITETLENGKVKKTVFNEDGSIEQTILNDEGVVTTLTTTFNKDGSITRTRV